MKCRHCKDRPVSRPRGLCWECYYTPEIRTRYVSLSIYARKGVQQPKRVKPASYPTCALPGSLEKIIVLAGRAHRGECLWHDDDATFKGWSRMEDELSRAA